MEYVSSDRKLLPYGMMNFEDIRLDNYYYVDKTSFIPLIEQSDRFFFFIRPRRFGKSLTLNMLQHYYDVRTKDKFDSLFGDLYIGKHPTKDRNSYLVIKLNFSGITGELHNYRKSLDEHCRIVFDYFCDVYADYLPEGIKEKMAEKDGVVSQFEYLFTECARVNQKIYLFIDEYDHFTNTILSDVDSLNRYTDETHKEGYLRAFFNKIKSGTDSSRIKPVEAERFQKAVDKALSYHSLLLKEEKEAIETIVAAEYFFVKAERRYFKVNFSDILFIEGLKDYVILQLNDQRIITRMSLKAIFDLLPKSIFLRVNKSYIVNTDHIESFDNNDIFIKSYEIAIGNSYRDDFFEGFVMKQRL